jgi:peptidoglycan/xylan/chitin deacetylase (PgdA/CDA1 family)
MQLFGTLVARVDTPRQVVALTFDDGPRVEYLDDVLEPLAARGVKATFFVTGFEASAAPEATRRIVEAGHELGNHSFSHTRMVLKSPAFVRDEVERTDAVIRAAGYSGEIRFRPPFGYKLVILPWYLAQSGRTTVTWDVEPDSYPDVAASPEAIARHVVERARPGSIILLHVWYPVRRTSREAVPLVVDRLLAKGFRFVTVGELAGEGSRQRSGT